tara:strand:+ start:93 stop:1583 length:1491 start_codon:yes stop_codon:yes gene_type:complete
VSHQFKILAPNGSLAINKIRADSGLYRTPQSVGSRKYRPRNSALNRRDPNPLRSGEWLNILRLSREIFAQKPAISGAIVAKNSYAVDDAWDAQYVGEDKEWGDEVEAWLRDRWYPVADESGIDFVSSLKVSAMSLDYEGDDLALFTKTPNGFPQIRIFSAPQIGSRENDTEIKDGQFKGAIVSNGIIKNRKGRTIGYQILGATAEDDRTISARNSHLLFEPIWRNQERGISMLASTILDILDTQDIDDYTKAAVKLASSIGLKHFNESGEADETSSMINSDSSAADSNLADMQIETIEEGIWYLKHNSEDVQTLTDHTPSPNREAFIQRLEQYVLSRIGWAYELVIPTGVGGAAVRAIQDRARQSIRSRQVSIKRRALRCVQYAVASAMKSGRISRNDSDWYKWNFTKPKTLTVDEGHDHKKDIEDLRAGTLSEADYVSKHTGKPWDETRATVLNEKRLLLDQSKTLAGEYGITIGQALELLNQRSPNPQPINTTE